MANATFEEVGRIQKTDSTAIVISKVIVDGIETGRIVNKFIDSDKYTGFAKGGIIIPKEDIEELISFLTK